MSLTAKELKEKERPTYEDYAWAYLEGSPVITAAGKSYRYTGTHYRVIDKPTADLRRWFQRNKIPQSNNLIGNVWNICEAITETAHALPCWSDGRKQKILAFENGLLDLDAGELLAHSPNWLSAWCLPCRYDPGAICPTWEWFVSECLNGDAQQVSLLQEWVGYVLSGDTKMQKYMVHVGAAKSGKSTIANVIRSLVGPGGTAFNIRQLAGRFGMVGLQGKSYAVCGEVELQGCKERAQIMETLKSVTGNDAIQVERKGDNCFYSERLPVRFHVVCNTMPILKDPSLALARRMLILKSDNQAEHEDVLLEDRLMTEAAGIVRWALEGYRRLTAVGGFTVPDRMKAELSEIRREASPAIAFLKDRCKVSEWLANGSHAELTTTPDQVRVEKAKLWEAVIAWARVQQVEVEPVWFWRDLRASLPKLAHRSQHRLPSGKVVDVVEGVSLSA